MSEAIHLYSFFAFVGLAIAYAKFSLIGIIFCGHKPRTVYQSGTLPRFQMVSR